VRGLSQRSRLGNAEWWKFGLSRRVHIPEIAGSNPASATMTSRCANCAHFPHPDGVCKVEQVTGPRSNLGHAIFDQTEGEQVGYEHTGRYVIPCGCVEYAPVINGKTIDDVFGKG
jgi:hypothetical protein